LLRRPARRRCLAGGLVRSLAAGQASRLATDQSRRPGSAGCDARRYPGGLRSRSGGGCRHLSGLADSLDLRWSAGRCAVLGSFAGGES
jgi:hypothetical protein